jgi:4-diphosphocytidyl-2-C-methyl-D-erythritol kinase
LCLAAAVKDGTTLHLFSPAKVNLFLRIIRKRSDGYHELASLFQTVGLGDSLDLELLPETANKDEFECNMPGVPVDETNLVIRAFTLFREKTGLQRFFRADLRKTIPAQAGMGGGSSNAATAFFGANALCGYPGSPDDLLQWTDDPYIGSDATFFLSHGTAYCTGRGEVVTPVPALPLPDDLPVYLVKPSFGLSTPKVFKAFDLASVSSVDPERLLETFSEKGVAHTSWVNDLERPAFVVSPELHRLKAFLASEEWGFNSVLMSGSGSTIFCLGEPRGGLGALTDRARSNGFQLEGVWRTHFLRRDDGAEQWYKAPAAEVDCN